MQKIIKYALAFCTGSTASLPAIASDNCGVLLTSAFVESAPRDNFTFQNSSQDGWVISNISIDLEPSAGKLIFDTADGGDGIEVFQTYRTESGDANLSAVTEPVDGGKTMQLDFSSFSAGQSFRFSVDVDDTLARSELRQIRVTGSELQGATLKVTFTNNKVAGAEPVIATGSYNQNNQAQVKPEDC